MSHSDVDRLAEANTRRTPKFRRISVITSGKIFKITDNRVNQPMAPEFFIADYDNAEHASAVVDLLDAYANDPMGGSEPLPVHVKTHLTSTLATIPGAFSVLGTVEGNYVALANCFMGFSTFACKPLINIHDLAVVASARGLGLSQGLLGFVEKEARSRECCKVTLEVLQGNPAALAAYRKFGFLPYSLDEDTGDALFLQKKL